jgi:hypothetical protein
MKTKDEIALSKYGCKFKDLCDDRKRIVFKIYLCLNSDK